MFNSIISSTDTTIATSGSLISIGVAIVLGIVVACCYMFTQKKGTYTKDFIVALTILPAIVAVVIMLVGSNIARAFSLAGAFALVRFRSTPGSAKDIAVVFFTMAVGLASGLGFISFAAVVAVIICLLIVVLSVTKYGENASEEKLLKISIPENLNYKGAFDSIFETSLKSYELRQVKTTNMGSMFELQYVVCLKPGTDEKDFIDELRCRNGNLNISLGMMPDKTGTML